MSDEKPAPLPWLSDWVRRAGAGGIPWANFFAIHARAGGILLMFGVGVQPPDTQEETPDLRQTVFLTDLTAMQLRDILNAKYPPAPPSTLN